MAFFTIVLAAGEGTRMRSTRAKVAHELLGKPLIRWVVDAAKSAESDAVITVVGHAREQVIPLIENDTIVVVQEQRLGTGHAIMIARETLLEQEQKSLGQTRETREHKTQEPEAREDGRAASLVVLCGDTPLITAQTIATLAASQQEDGAAACVLTHILDDPTGYGRIIRDEKDALVRIVEEKDATPAERAVKECNSGAYCFDLAILLENVRELDKNNAQGEYYLTDIIEKLVAKGLPVTAHLTDAEQTQGINSRAQLAQATKAMQRRVNATHLDAGVTMLDPELVWIGPDVSLEHDVEILPLTFLNGTTRVARGSVLGPNTRVTDCVIGKDCQVEESVLVEAVLEDGVSCGPRAYLRPGTVMKAGSKAGTHVEIKNSTVGPGSKVPHLSYLGDTQLGEDVNIGAGAITCNYDGFSKNQTTIGDRSFIGSDTMLVAPVTVGSDTVTGAGSVITDDVPDGALAVERTRQHIVKGWAREHVKKKTRGREMKSSRMRKKEKPQ
ncbi:MAG: bifunctional UDP-N-acetylglucosamine diphosphorylase/glucosamine-1-phosphate N-acetyltransferase GlmU [Coriobacteriales bacterium]|jgi:bifunctional UDP-N-acetylglucosamine pyrophosphorylase/glucosamine-1-phosphate N-acetyltransferase|nr:bifunctional UDP-N-acetylglucosamine diphosphorylase/glucosamine-1-phosphate N-acetyltransferase GlmU [Coriobacteriales bacterium]